MKVIINNILSKYKQLYHPTSIRSNQEPLKCGTVVKVGLIPTVNGAGCVYLQLLSRGNNVEGANCRVLTILVHLTCL